MPHAIEDDARDRNGLDADEDAELPDAPASASSEGEAEDSQQHSTNGTVKGVALEDIFNDDEAEEDEFANTAPEATAQQSSPPPPL